MKTETKKIPARRPSNVSASGGCSSCLIKIRSDLMRRNISYPRNGKDHMWRDAHVCPFLDAPLGHFFFKRGVEFFGKGCLPASGFDGRLGLGRIFLFGHISIIGFSVLHVKSINPWNLTIYLWKILSVDKGKP